MDDKKERSPKARIYASGRPVGLRLKEEDYKNDPKQLIK